MSLAVPRGVGAIACAIGAGTIYRIMATLLTSGITPSNTAWRMFELFLISVLASFCLQSGLLHQMRSKDDKKTKGSPMDQTTT
jgi:hypothetical protein